MTSMGIIAWEFVLKSRTFCVLSLEKQNKNFLQLYCPNGVSHMGNAGCLPRGKSAATESRYSTYYACWVFKCFHNPPNSDMDYGIFNVRTDVNACDCTLEFTHTV